MAMAGRRLIVFRSTVSPKWLCTATEAVKTVTEDKGDNLYRRLRALNGSEEAKIAETMDEWVKERNNLSRFDIIGSVRLLRRDKKFSQAIQVYEWMEKSNHEMNEVDHAIRIDLLAKHKGVVPAEEYFNSLQGSAKSKKIYGALLSGYCREKMLEKALELFEKIKALGFESSLDFSNLMGLYLLVGQPEKVPLLAQEMEEQNIAADWFTYTKLIDSYISLKNFDALEGVLKKMDLNKVKCDWFTCKKIATFYVNTGNLEKANAALHKLETREKLHYYNHFHTLITLYAQASNLSGVKRTWESLKLTFPKPNNTSYLVMLLALSKLGDVDTLEKCFREWESDCSNYYDFRVSNVVLKSYLKRDMIEDANLVYEGMLKKGAKPNLRTLELLANYHIGKQHIDLALKYVEMAPSKTIPEKRSWFPSDETVRMFLRYFEENYDVEKAEKFSNIMKKIGHLDSTLHDSLLRVNIAAG